MAVELEPVFDVTAHDRPATAVLVAPAHDVVATCSLDGHARLFQQSDGALLKDLFVGSDDGPRHWAQALMTNRGQDWLYVGLLQELKVFGIPDGEFRTSLPMIREGGPFIDGVRGLSASPNLDGFASCSGNGVLQLWDETSRVRKEIVFRDSELHCVAYSPDSRWLAVAFEQAHVLLADLDMERTYRLDPHVLPSMQLPTEAGVYGLAFENSRSLIVGTHAGDVQQWWHLDDGRWGRLEDLVKHPGTVTCVAAAGSYVVTGCETGRLTVTKRSATNEIESGSIELGVGIEALAVGSEQSGAVFVATAEGGLHKFLIRDGVEVGSDAG